MRRFLLITYLFISGMIWADLPFQTEVPSPMELPSITLGSWSFIGSSTVHEEGMYGYVGVTQGFSSHLEISTFTVAMITPDILSEIYQGIDLGISFLYPRSAELPDAPSFVSMYADIGLLLGFHNLQARDSNTMHTSAALYFRLTPLSLGNNFYGSREKIGSFGILYSLTEKEVGFFWNPVIYDRYFGTVYDFHKRTHSPGE